MLAVLVFHLRRQWLPGGFVGVDVFFVVSGFLITSILLREYENNSFSLWKFYQRRIARLFPAFFTVALATLVGAFFVYSAQDLASSAAGLVAATLSVANFKYMLQGNYFTISPDAQPLLHYWSLSVEEQFYLLFPAVLLFLYLKAHRHVAMILSAMLLASLVACIALTHSKPDWAFYLLPTRAWELMAGSILANLSMRAPTGNDKAHRWMSLPLVGVALIVASFFLIGEGPTFPGYLALLPVAGTACFLGFEGGSRTWPERLLSAAPMVFIGRMSYSLYLWHWPVFSFVDYRLYLASPVVRVSLKLALSFAAASLCFFFIERPGRVFLNQPRRRRLAFAFLACALALCVPLGTVVRRANYIDARMGTIASGGIVFKQAHPMGSIVLMGDSNASMYGTLVKAVAQALHFTLHVISVPGGDALPRLSGPQSQLWLDSVTFVKRENPEALVLVCNWPTKSEGRESVVEIAVNALQQHTRRLILITQPPGLPQSGTRESMRDGSRPPFMEDQAQRERRTRANAFLRSLRRDNVIVIDIESTFTAADGSVRYIDADGGLLYQDGGHLSDAGARLVKADVMRAIRESGGGF